MLSIPSPIAVPLRRLALVFALAGTLGASSGFASSPVGPDLPAADAGTGTPIAWRGVRVSGPYIALTFDDGPDPEVTPRVLDILKARGIHATFFVEGQHVQQYPAIIQREHAEGHEIGNHTWDHPNLAQLPEDAVRAELNRTRDALTAVLGQPPRLMRPPYGSLTPAQETWIHADLSYTIILWDVNSHDWRHNGAAAVEQQILARAHRGGIILDHDVQPDAVAAMPDTLDKLLAAGYRFVTIPELLALDRPPAPVSP